MTLLINDLISVLEKDNDNSKLNDLEDPNFLYKNLISLLSKNIESFITSTERTEDILLRGLNDMRSIREEQDKIARDVQYNQINSDGVIIKENVPNTSDRDDTSDQDTSDSL